MAVHYIIDASGKKQAVVVPMDEWKAIQERLNEREPQPETGREDGLETGKPVRDVPDFQPGEPLDL